jgi:hypothetical protein
MDLVLRRVGSGRLRSGARGGQGIDLRIDSKVHVSSEFLSRARLAGLSGLHVEDAECFEDWLAALDPSRSILTSIALTGSFAYNFKVVLLAPFKHLVTVDLSRDHLFDRGLSDLLVALGDKAFLPSLTMLNLSGNKIGDFTCLDELLKRPCSRPLRLEIEGVTVEIAARKSVLPTVTIDLNNQNKHAVLPPLITQKVWAGLAACGRPTFMGRWGKSVMDASVIGLIAEQGVRFPDVEPHLRFPMSLAGKVAELVRPGGSFRAMVVRDTTPEFCTDDAGLAALMTSLRQAGAIEVKFEKVSEPYGAHLMRELVKPLLSGAGRRDLTVMSKVLLRVSSSFSFQWDREQRFLRMVGVPSELLDRVAAVMTGSRAAFREVQVRLSRPCDLDDADSLVPALLTVAERVELRCSGLDVHSLFSEWAEMATGRALSP